MLVIPRSWSAFIALTTVFIGVQNARAVAEPAAPVLTRAAAERLIIESPQVQAFRTTLALRSDWATVADAADLMIASVPLPALASEIQPCAVPLAFAHIAVGCKSAPIVPKRPFLAPLVKVTGIAEGAQTRSAEFLWEYRSIPTPLRFLAIRGGSGVASFQKYDDGWRIVNVQIDTQPTPYRLTPADATELRRLSAEHESREIVVRQSKVGKVVNTMTFSNEPSKKFEIWETFIRATAQWGSNQSYATYDFWYGNVTGIRSFGTAPAFITISTRPGLDGSDAPTRPNFLPCLDISFPDPDTRNFFLSRLTLTVRNWERRFPTAYVSPINVVDDGSTSETRCRAS